MNRVYVVRVKYWMMDWCDVTFLPPWSSLITYKSRSPFPLFLLYHNHLATDYLLSQKPLQIRYTEFEGKMPNWWWDIVSLLVWQLASKWVFRLWTKENQGTFLFSDWSHNAVIYILWWLDKCAREEAKETVINWCLHWELCIKNTTMVFGSNFVNMAKIIQVGANGLTMFSIYFH